MSEIDNAKVDTTVQEILMPPASRYAGQAMDTSTRHSISIRPRGDRAGEDRAGGDRAGGDRAGGDRAGEDRAGEDRAGEDRADGDGDALIHLQDERCVVDYFFHEGKFWRAVFPLDGVEQVFGQAFNFSRPKTRNGQDGPEIVFNKYGLPRRTLPFLNHVQSRFSFSANRAIELYPLGSQDFGNPDHVVHDIVYSLEAVGPGGVMFNVRDGLAGNLISAHRFLSVQEMVFERIVVENQYVAESPPLPLNDREKRALLVGSLIRGHRAGMSEPYYLYRICGTNNCTTSPLQILDNVVTYRWHQRIGSIVYRLPLSPRFYLRVRGMDSDPTFRKLVRTEFEDYINDAEIQQRKRDYVRQQIRIRRATRGAR